MTHEHKKALDAIILICERSRQPTHRIERIYDIALQALGLTANQRNELVLKLRHRTIQKQRDDFTRKIQRKEQND